MVGALFRAWRSNSNLTAPKLKTEKMVLGWFLPTQVAEKTDRSRRPASFPFPDAEQRWTTKDANCLPLSPRELISFPEPTLQALRTCPGGEHWWGSQTPVDAWRSNSNLTTANGFRGEIPA